MWLKVAVINFSISALRWNNKVIMNCLFIMVLLCPSVPLRASSKPSIIHWGHCNLSTEIFLAPQRKRKKNIHPGKIFYWLWWVYERGKNVLLQNRDDLSFFFLKKVGNPLIITKTQNVPHGFEATLRGDVSLFKMSLNHQKAVSHFHQ